jgi:phage terminase large subunit GpA-like protein
LSSAEAFEGADDIRRAWLAGLAPDPAPTVSQWADRHRVLSSRSAPEAGSYWTSRTPCMRGIMDALSPRNPVQRASQYSRRAGSDRLWCIIARCSRHDALQ